MYEINKEKFGTFVAGLRKEKGYTQKELAGRLFISDKAISKWETGQSIPDTALLIPLSELLDVSVTELLKCERLLPSDNLDITETESLVKTAIIYNETAEIRSQRKKWVPIYLAALILGWVGTYLCHQKGTLSESVLTMTILSSIFGAYFSFLVKTKLPYYYDENRISGVLDGPFRMNIPGVTFNNSNWPYIIRCGKVWSCATLATFPLLSLVGASLAPTWWLSVGSYVLLVCYLAGLFLPIYITAKKHE